MNRVPVVCRFPPATQINIDGEEVVFEDCPWVKDCAVIRAVNNKGEIIGNGVYKVVHAKTGFGFPVPASDTPYEAIQRAKQYLKERGIKQETWEKALLKAQALWEGMVDQARRKDAYAQSDIQPE